MMLLVSYLLDFLEMYGFLVSLDYVLIFLYNNVSDDSNNTSNDDVPNIRIDRSFNSIK